MRGIALGFILAGVVAGLIGMIWGIQMSASHNHDLSPAHGHLNLVGWVSLMLFGLYYHNVPKAADSRSAKLHLVIAIVGVVVMAPGIAIVLSDGPEIFAQAGSFITLISMILFAVTVVRFRVV